MVYAESIVNILLHSGRFLLSHTQRGIGPLNSHFNISFTVNFSGLFFCKISGNVSFLTHIQNGLGGFFPTFMRESRGEHVVRQICGVS